MVHWKLALSIWCGTSLAVVGDDCNRDDEGTQGLSVIQNSVATARTLIQREEEEGEQKLQQPDGVEVQGLYIPKNEMENKIREIIAAMADQLRGPKGEKGEKGEKGDKGDKGVCPDCKQANCPRLSEWSYILDYSDERGAKDDIPNNGADIKNGFATENAFFIGNAELEKIDFSNKDVEVCFLSRSASCIEACEPVTANSGGDGGVCNFPSLSDDLKKMIAVLSGQCVTGNHNAKFMDHGDPRFPAPHADRGWQAGPHWTSAVVGSNRLCKGSGYGFHVTGYGITLCTEELKEDFTSDGPGVELSYEKHYAYGNFDVDTMHIRYRTKSV